MKENKMDWTTVKEFPKYNPHQIKLTRLSRGLDIEEVSGDVGISRTMIGAFERGLREPTESQMKTLADYYEYPISRYTDCWDSTELEIHGCMGVNVEIDYFKYKVFRDKNPLTIAW